MGPVNWLAVILAVVAALLWAAVWYGPMFGHVRRAMLAPGKMALTAGLLFLNFSDDGPYVRARGPRNAWRRSRGSIS